MLTITDKRKSLFLFGCLVIRIGIVLIAYYIESDWLWILGIFATMLILSWLRIMIFSPREKGIETFGKKIWWQNYRIIHVINYTVFAVLAFLSSDKSWIPLAFDVSIGFLLWLYHWF